MNFLKKYDFNDKTGWVSVILVSIGISFLFFAGAYVLEGQGWLAAYNDDKNDLYLDIGWNWMRGGGVAFLVSSISLGISGFLLKKNIKIPKQVRDDKKRRKLDLNGTKGLIGLASLATSFAFFFNGIFYKQEAARWFFGGLETAESWKLHEAAAWLSTSSTMTIIGILLSAAGFILLVLQWRESTMRTKV